MIAMSKIPGPGGECGCPIGISEKVDQEIGELLGGSSLQEGRPGTLLQASGAGRSGYHRSSVPQGVDGLDAQSGSELLWIDYHRGLPV
jgi:hypothetical protein